MMMKVQIGEGVPSELYCLVDVSILTCTCLCTYLFHCRARDLELIDFFQNGKFASCCCS